MKKASRSQPSRWFLLQVSTPSQDKRSTSSATGYTPLCIVLTTKSSLAIATLMALVPSTPISPIAISHWAPHSNTLLVAPCTTKRWHRRSKVPILSIMPTAVCWAIVGKKWAPLHALNALMTLQHPTRLHASSRRTTIFAWAVCRFRMKFLWHGYRNMVCAACI